MHIAQHLVTLSKIIALCWPLLSVGLALLRRSPFHPFCEQCFAPKLIKRAPMTDKRKAWNTLTPVYRSKLLSEVFANSAGHLHDESDFRQYMKAFLQKLGRDRPDLAESTSSILAVLDTQGIVKSLANLRAEHADKPLHLPSITVNELDHALVHSTKTRASLEALGYPLSIPHYGKIHREQAVLRASPSTNLGGRPSLVNDAAAIELVRKILLQNTKESERIVVVGRGAKRKMVVANHLVQTKHRIWCETEELHKAVSWMSFCRILQMHFPHVRNPRRNTDVCRHCKAFERDLLPAALKCVDRATTVLTNFCQHYFQDFQANLDDKVKYVEMFHAYVSRREATSGRDPLRQGLPVQARLALHSAEAQALHRLKPHVEILKAYEWHQVSARRQAEFVATCRANLPPGLALLQVDFKENVKYPMGPDETSEEWHAQNKLSLTVFGANAIVPTHLGLN